MIFALPTTVMMMNDWSGDPEKLPKEIVLKRAADLAEALYSMPRCVNDSNLNQEDGGWGWLWWW